METSVLLGGFSALRNSLETRIEMAESGTLYVFLHGLTVVRERGSMLELALPRVRGHVYRAGSWLSESTIQARSVLRLHGVEAGMKSLSGTDFTINLPDCSLTSRGRAATLWLPRPKAIHGFLRSTLPQGGNVVTRMDSGIGQPVVATVQVLIYNYDDEAEVVLEGHPLWEPASTGGAMSLHIISTSEEVESDEHERETADALRRVIRGYPGVTFAKPISPPDWRDTDNPDYGFRSGPTGLMAADGSPGLQADGEYIVTGQGQLAFARAELEDFRARIARIGRLGRLKQEKRPIEGLWDEPDLLGEETSNCVTYFTS
jgi:hypothetical protein